MSWQDLFLGHILDRGLDYYENGYVLEITETEDGYEATVDGSEEYYVNISIKNGKVSSLSCTCPYAESGLNCKHMAAVLFAIDDEMDCVDTDDKCEDLNSNDSAKTYDNMHNQIDELVKNADEKLVREFLSDVLKNNDRILCRFKNAVCSEVSESDIKQYKKQIDRIFYEYKGRDEFINYYNASGFISELSEFIDEDIDGMLNKHAYDAAFELSIYLFVKTGNVDMDDSDGGTSMISEDCSEVWSTILEDCKDKQVEKRVFQWFISHLDGSVIDYMEDYIEKILFDYFMDKEYLEEKLKLTDKIVESLSKSKDSWSSYHGLGHWIGRHIELLTEMKTDKAEIEKYYLKYWRVTEVRRRAINECINKKNYARAIEILIESKKLDKEWPGLVRAYSCKLKDLYKQTRNEEDYKNELWEIILKYSNDNLDIYRELKDLYKTDEWQKERKKIFKVYDIGYGLIEKLYLEENMYDELLECVIKSVGLYKLEEYEKLLKPMYPNELLGKYKKEVCSMALHTSDRKRYCEIVTVLRRMQKYKTGKEMVNELVEDWKVSYKNRRAMMEELSKLKL